MQPRHATIETRTLGKVTLVAAGDAVTGLFFEHHYPRPEVPFGNRVSVEDDDLLARAASELDEYLAGERQRYELQLRRTGDVFLHRVLTLVQQIPYGSTTTYGAIARHLGNEFGDESLAKRVGKAVGRNPLCVFIPCHRVVSAGGSLNGYAGGIGCKRRLLDLERGVLAEAPLVASAPGQEPGWWR
jgi:methylated-DNA-[protein]-cysteine S-methyltransferase